MDENEVKAMQVKLAALEATVAELKNPKPAPKVEAARRYDPTAGFGMPAEVAAEMAKAVPDATVRDIAGDHRRGVAERSVGGGSAKPGVRLAPSERGWWKRGRFPRRRQGMGTSNGWLMRRMRLMLRSGGGDGAT